MLGEVLPFASGISLEYLRLQGVRGMDASVGSENQSDPYRGRPTRLNGKLLQWLHEDFFTS